MQLNSFCQKLFVGALLFFCSNYLCASLGVVKDVRVWPSPRDVRVVIDFNQKIKYKVFLLHHPERLVVDLYQTRLGLDLKKLQIRDRLIKKIRHGIKKNKLRLVIDLNRNIKLKSFFLNPNEQYGYRLVIDIIAKEQKVLTAKYVANNKEKQHRNFIIAIDAGHGGDDPGAIGSTGITEKSIVLKISKKVQKLLLNNTYIDPVLIRGGDYYISLNDRIQLARKVHADLLVSVHADAFRDPKVEGASVYVLSLRGASSAAAKWLADKENRADLIGGVSLDDKDPVLASVLLDLSQAATRTVSAKIADSVLGEMGKISKLHKYGIQRANFVVLRSPDIPSILVETGFISNSKGERNLSSNKYQDKIAKAIVRGIVKYYHNRPRPRYINNDIRPQIVKYKIKNGDTLSEIAERYHTSVKKIKLLNHLTSNSIISGQMISIPN